MLLVETWRTFLSALEDFLFLPAVDGFDPNFTRRSPIFGVKRHVYLSFFSIASIKWIKPRRINTTVTRKYKNSTWPDQKNVCSLSRLKRNYRLRRSLFVLVLSVVEQRGFVVHLMTSRRPDQLISIPPTARSTPPPSRSLCSPHISADRQLEKLTSSVDLKKGHFEKLNVKVTNKSSFTL